MGINQQGKATWDALTGPPGNRKIPYLPSIEQIKVSTIGSTLQNPFKGLRSYEEHESHSFFGREHESSQIYRLIDLNFLTVICGKKGVGKTSLLNAGVFPRLRKNNFLPIRIRVNYTEPAPAAQVKAQLGLTLQREQVKVKGEDGIITGFNEGETVWEYVHRVSFVNKEDKPVTPVLVLDQFEEMFTVGKQHLDVSTWQDEMYYLIEDQYPEGFRQRMAQQRKVVSYVNKSAQARIVICIREDYLPHLAGLKTRIHTIDRVMFRLTDMDVPQAREVIHMGGRGITDEDSITQILRAASMEKTKAIESRKKEQLEVEPVLLSLLCYQFKQNKGQKWQGKKSGHHILEDFYQLQIRDIPDRVQKFIEKNLVNESGDRIPLRMEAHTPHKESLNTLLARRILGSVHSYDKEYIELIHDVLAPAILTRKRKRASKIRNFIISGLIMVLTVMVGGIIQINNLYNKAYINNLIYESRNILAEDNTKAARIAEFTYNKSSSPSPRLMQLLVDIADSANSRSFYTATFNHRGPVISAVFSPDGSRILTLSGDNTARLWDDEGKNLAVFKHEFSVYSAVFSPDGSRVLTASRDNTAKLWDTEGKNLAVFKHKSSVYSAVFSPDGSRVLTASVFTAKLWDDEGKNLAVFKHQDSVFSAVFSPDGSRVLTASRDNTAKLWDDEGKNLAVFKHQGSVYSAVFSPDGSRVLTASLDNTAKLWDAEGKNLAVFKHQNWVRSAVFSPDGSRVLTASADNTAKLWDAEGKNLAVFKHQDWVRSAVFSPDGSRVLTASSDNTAKLWDDEGKNLAVFKHEKEVFSAVFSPDGTRILTTSIDGTTKFWFTPEGFIKWLKTAPIAKLTEEEIKKLERGEGLE